MNNIQQIKQRFGIVGACREINAAVETALQVAPTELTVLVIGENGTGKDAFSRIIHHYSKRKHSPFIAINCGAIPEGTIDSELFGHEKGSFTGAYEMRKGYFEAVEKGTIFLDEIAEMPLATQSRLLRLLENGEYIRVGASEVRHADVRVVAATNKSLVELIRQGKFREDLFFRLNTVTIMVPPLRERGADIEMLFKYFALEFADKYRREPIVLDEEAIPLLYKYRWPGNVREMRNLVEKLTVLIKGERISEEALRNNLFIQERYLPSVIRLHDGRSAEAIQDLPGQESEQIYKLIHELRRELSDLKQFILLNLKNRETSPVAEPAFAQQPHHRPVIHEMPYAEYEEEMPAFPRAAAKPAVVTPLLEESLSLEKKEREMILRALRKHHDNRKRAAEELGISERTLYRKIKNYDIAS